MITSNQFDAVFDCQKVFKTLMNAMARPGKIFSIADSAKKLEREQAALFACALTVLDNRCRFFVWENEVLSQDLIQMTYAVPSHKEAADYLFIPQTEEAATVHEAVLPAAKVGTLPEPHKSATLFIALESLAGDRQIRLTGPGVDGELSTALPEECIMWLQTRGRMAWEFPCGVELYFLTQEGQVLCIPRTTKIEVA